MRFLLALLFTSISATLSGQGVVPPFRIGQVSPLPGLNAGSLPGGGSVYHVHMVHLPGDPPSVSYCAVTLLGLPSSYGGAGNFDFLCGRYDVLTDTFTPNTDAAPLNTPGDERSLMLHHSGLFAVFDRPVGAAWLASRSAIGQPWQPVGPVNLCPCSYTPFHYPALADYQGQPHLLYARQIVGWTGYAVVMAPIDLISGYLTGAYIPLVVPPTPSDSVIAPIPVTDPNGEFIGLSHSVRRSTSDVDRYVSLDLDPATPAVLVNDTASVMNAGGFVGGRFFDWDAPFIAASDTFWFTGGRALVGGTMFVRMFSPPTSGPEVYLSAFAASSNFLPVGQPLPPLRGLVGIDVANAWASALFTHDNRNGEARTSFAIPNVPALSGARLPVQCATFEASAATIYLGNTAVLSVE